MEIIINSGAFQVAVTLLTLVGLITIFNWIANKFKKPGEQAAIAALQPYIYKAIMAAYKLSETAMDQFCERMNGADKAKIADMIYDMIPEVIDINGTKIPVKTMIPHEAFHALIQKSFDEFILFYSRNKEEFEKEMQKWAEENKPVISLKI